MRKQLLRLEITGQLRERDLALRTVSAACRMALGGGDRTARRLESEMLSAVGEAFNNIAKHGYRGRRRGMVEIEVSIEATRLAVELRDYGRSFDPRSAPAPDLEALPESGMGAFIIARMVDEVDYRPGHPNVLRLVKHLT